MNLMVEDSKTWFEIYEVAIAAYEENDKYLNKIENNNNEDKIGAFQFQQLESFETKLTERYSTCLSSMSKAGLIHLLKSIVLLDK